MTARYPITDRFTELLRSLELVSDPAGKKALRLQLENEVRPYA